MVIRSPNDKIALVQSPSITQETKARFNELLNAALSKEVAAETDKQSVSVPKIVPRRRLSAVKSPPAEQELEKYGDRLSAYSSEESPGNRRVKRQVIAEVHSSRTQLIQSSSDDDILAEKKMKKKRKKSRWKQVSESVQVMTEKEQDDSSVQRDRDVFERSSSRLSSRSYVVETPTFPIENLKSIGNKSITESPRFNEDIGNKMSPSRLSNRSYTVETPSFPSENLKSLASKSGHQISLGLENNEHSNVSPSRLSNRSYTIEKVLVESPVKDEPPKVKTPIPLPRRKSLKSPETDQEKNLRISNLRIENGQNDTVLTICESNVHETDDYKPSRAEVKLQESHSQHTEDDMEMPLAVRKQKRKKKRRKRSKSREAIELQEFSVKGGVSQYSELKSGKTQSITSVKSLVKAAERLEGKSSQGSGDGIVSVTIHGVDCPIIDPLVRHPVVCLYIVDTSVGEFYRKSEPSRSVCYLQENTDYVQPVTTHLFDFKQRKSVVPAWEECLLLNDSSSHLLTPFTLLLFELCDFVPASVASSRHSRLGSTAGRHVVAWAFLRPVANGGSLHPGLRLRLQLYKPGRHPKNLRPLSPAVYEWWGSAARHKFPGCLYVTVSEVETLERPPSPRLRSQSALQAEQGSQASVASASNANSDMDSDERQQGQEAAKPTEVLWSRLPAQSCKLPNTRLHNLPVDGSMSVRFSGNGLWLACGRQDIQVYSVPHGQHTATLTGHQGLVYCLRWSLDSKILLSASADCTVCVWKLHSSRNPLLQMLAHPSFVYSAEFIQPCTLVSGCCDAVVRVWKGNSHSSYQLSQELCGHSGFVSSICVTTDGTRVVSADSQGSLRIYDVEEDGSLSVSRELRVREVRGVTISSVIAHPGGHRLLVHSRDSTLRSVDLATGAVIQTFKGCTNERMQTGACVSPCGSLVLACGEDGAVVAWDGHTGALRAIYCALVTPGSAAIHYHPHDHMLVVAGLAQPPVYILTFNRNATGEAVGLHMIKNEITAADVIETMKSIKNSNKWQKATSKILQKPQSSMVVGKEKRKKKENGIVEEISEKETQSTNWPSLPQLECFIEKTSGEKDLRLLEIIRRMDNIILAAKQSSQSQ